MICSLLHPVKVQSTGSPVKSRSGDASSVRLPPNFGAAKEDDCRSLDSTMVKMLPPVKGPSSAFQPPPRREAPVTCTSLGKCSFQRLGMCGGSRKDHEKERRIRRVCVGLDLRRDGFLLQSLTWWTHISPPRKTAAFSKKKKMVSPTFPDLHRRNALRSSNFGRPGPRSSPVQAARGWSPWPG